MLAARGEEGRDRRLHAVEPLVLVAHGQDHLGLGPMAGQLAPDPSPRPVSLGAVALEHLVPIDPLAARHGLPGGKLLGMVADLEHVVARPEAEPFQGELERIGTRATEAGADDFQRHGSIPTSSSMRRGS